MKRCISGSNTTGSLQCCSCSTACIPARSASVRHQCSSSLQIHRTSRCDHVTSLLKELHWLPVPERIEFKLCALLYKCLSTRQQDGVPHWQFTASDGRQVTRTPAVVLIVNVSRPGDTSCDTGWQPPGHETLYQTSSQQCQLSDHSALLWRLICSPELFDIDNTRDTFDFVTCFCSALRFHHANLMMTLIVVHSYWMVNVGVVDAVHCSVQCSSVRS